MYSSQPASKRSGARKFLRKIVSKAVVGAGLLLCSPCLGLWGAVEGTKKGYKWIKAEQYRIPPRITKRKKALVRIELGKTRSRSRAKRKLLGKGRKTNVVESEDADLRGWRKLPYEIRRMIYEEYFCAAGAITITFGRNWRVIGRSEQVRRASADGSTPGHLNLLRACRSIYVEAFPLLYSLPTYQFHDPIAFLIFCTAITPPAFHKLSNIALDFRKFPNRGRNSSPGNWPEPPPVYFHRGCVIGYKPAIKTTLLQRPKSYVNFRISGVRHYYNPLVLKACGNAIFRKRPTIWTWTCDVLGKMTGLKNLETRIGSQWICENDGVLQTLERAGIEPEGRGGMRSFIVKLWKPEPWDPWEEAEDPGEELRWRYVLIGDQGKWVEIPVDEWEGADGCVREPTKDESESTSIPY